MSLVQRDIAGRRSEPPLRRSPAERVLARVYTGPLGHLWGVGADLGSIWARYAWARLRRRS